MNNKLAEYRDNLVQLQETAVQQSAFKEGFNTVLNLNLFEKFVSWTQEDKNEIEINEIEDECRKLLCNLSEKEFEKKSLVYLYNYWCENVLNL